MARKFFGTDGVRGLANQEPITAPTALSLAMAAATQFTRGYHRHRVVIGKDTRLSGYMLEPALTAGFVAMGMDVVLLGPLPTPAVAMLTRSLRADLGVMISASHNPYEDNGIKLFGPDGFKLSDATELDIENKMQNGGFVLAPSAELGRAQRLDDARGRYIEFVKASFPRHLRLEGLKIVMDCAHGAAYKVAPTVLWELGAEVIPLGVDPDGFNINCDCGAVAPAALCARVRAEQADLGIALDGDADRVILCDEAGNVIDGDQILALTASQWAKTGRLKGRSVVTTVMSNLGLERYLNAQGIDLHRTPVGDRYVVEHMRAHGYNLGGEQSGHIVLGDQSTTGDGLMAALQVLAVMASERRAASETLRQFVPLPQYLRNVRAPGILLERPEVKAAISKAQNTLDQKGRLLIRRSGTEPVIRVMAESDDAVLVQRIVDDLIDLLQRAAAD